MASSTSIPVANSSTGFKKASGLATHPTTGELFATGINTDLATGDIDRSVLFTVNRNTGMGTKVGETGIEDSPIGEFNVAGLAFRADGTLFGYFERDDTPGTIDTGTGAGTGLTAFTSGVSCCGNGLTFVNGDLLHANQDELGELVQVTGLQTPIIDLDYTSPFFDSEDEDLDPRVAAMDVHPITGDIYASIIIGFSGDVPGPTAYLAILDPGTGRFTYLGASDAKVDAIAFFDVPASLPEPTTLLLLGLGLAGLGFARRRLD